MTTVGDERRDDTRGVRNNFPDRDAARDYRHPELPEPIQPAPADRERSYLTRAPRPLPVYFGAEFDSGVEGVALVTRVDRGSPADRAGLRPDDIVVSLNGEKVSSANDAMAILGSMRAGDRLDVEYSRQARVRAVLADSRDGAVATRSMQERVDVDRGYDGSTRRAYDSSYDTSRNDSSRDRPRTDPPRTERRGLGIFRRR